MSFKNNVVLMVTIFVVGAYSFKDSIPRTYTINLDLPPQERWKQVAQDYSQGIVALLNEIKQIVPPEAITLIDIIGKDISKYIPSPYNEEILGIAASVEGVTVGEIVLGNILYEVTAFEHGGKAEAKACTSIVAEALNGTIFHGRNLDYSFGSTLRNLTVVVDFQQGGKTVYIGTAFVGMVGLLSGMKPHGYTITLDERDQGRLWMNSLEALLVGTHGIAALHIRDALSDSSMTYDDAVRMLAYKPLIAPCYIIVGGTKPRQGVVITRDRISAVDMWFVDAFTDQWFLVETNYDHWVLPPPDDNRRDPAIKAMNELTRSGVGWSGLYSVLSTPPVLNNKTTYTVIMSADLPSVYLTWVRQPKP